jgi:hypothetical protein
MCGNSVIGRAFAWEFKPSVHVTRNQVKMVQRHNAALYEVLRSTQHAMPLYLFPVKSEAVTVPFSYRRLRHRLRSAVGH